MKADTRQDESNNEAWQVRLRQTGEVVLRELDAVARVSTPRARTIHANRGTEKILQAAATAGLANADEFSRSPFVAYVHFESNGRMRKAFICRGSAPDHGAATPDCEFVSYLAPRGRLAALALGKRTTVPAPSGAQHVVVVERDVFVSLRKGEFDAVQNLYEAIPDVVEEFASMRARIRDLIAAAPAVQKTHIAHGITQGSVAADSDVQLQPESSMLSAAPEWNRESLEQMLSAMDAQTAAENASASERRARSRRTARGVVHSLELRDQATLDDIQDEVFRLPLGTTLALTGAPGTGKSTTLIKRIAQKGQAEFLEEDERASLRDQEVAYLFKPERAWVLYTPNDLLRGYVKDALAKERLRATESNVRTWRDQQRRLARDVFHIFGTDEKVRFAPSREDVLKLYDPETLWDYVERFEEFWSERVQTVLERRWDIIDAASTSLETEGLVGNDNDSKHSAELYQQLAQSVRAVLGEFADLKRKRSILTWCSAAV